MFSVEQLFWFVYIYVIFMTMRIKILYEDKDVLAIDKPSGISVHPDGKSNDTSTKPSAGKTPNQSKLGTRQAITDWFLKKHPKAKNVGESIFVEGKAKSNKFGSPDSFKKEFREIKKPGIVHRLDKETSGVLLLAKNEKAYQFLKEQFSASALSLKTKGELTNKPNRIKKTYLAIVEGWPKNDHGIINKPIGRSPSDFRRRLAGRGARGELREAITEYKVLKRFIAPGIQNQAENSRNFYLRGSQPVLGEGRRRKNFESLEPLPFSLLEVSPKTGRTHQIRVHLKFLNHPVACDSLYDPKGFCPKGIARLALHARSIEFTNLAGKKIKVEAPVPKEIQRMIK
jgi:23S rRNA pseudouridine1911/1915/1917 synthase